MDLKKATMNVPTLDGPNWGLYLTHLQAAARILDCWDVTKGEILSGPGVSSITYNRLEFPMATVFTVDGAADRMGEKEMGD